MNRTTSLSGSLLFLLLMPVWVRAQPSTGRSAARAESAALSGNTLKTRLGVEVAEALLKDGDPEQRQRGFERLGSVGTAQALDLLLKAFDSGGAARSARDRLVAVRALAPHAGDASVREFLMRIMLGVGTNPGRSEAIDRQIEQAAALALGATGNDAGLAALGKALRQPGHVADTALDALLAFPPRNLEPIVQGGRSPSRSLLELLGALGDRRAIPALREIVRRAPNELRPAAALALAQLGVQETVELARHWLRHEPGAEFRTTATRILLEFHAPDAATAFSRLLDDEQTRTSALELANLVPLPALAVPLIRSAKAASGADQSSLLSALGRTGSREAFSFLGGILSAPETSSAAALALALAPEPEAEAVLEIALGAPATRRSALRASLVRKVALGSTPSGFSAALRACSSSRDPNDRALVAQASAVLEPERADVLLKHANATELRALSRAAWWPEVAQALAERLAEEPDPELREALAAGLVSTEAAERVPNDVLGALIDARGLAAPLAARALAARDSLALRPTITSLLQSDDPIFRSHAALGLGRSKESSALGVLERAYRFETEASVRLAIVEALAERPEPARSRPLGLARALDGSRAVRDAASLALAGVRPMLAEPGRQSAWLELGLDPGAARAEPRLGALIVTGSGLSCPAFADPDGVLLLPALPSGSFELRLAAPGGSDNAPKPSQP